MSEENIVWSTNEEEFNYDFCEALNDVYNSTPEGESIVGKTIWYGDAAASDCSKLVDADDVIDLLGDRAYDEFGEYADDFNDVSYKAKIELDLFLQEWITKNCKVSFWNVKNTKPYTITQEDADDLES